MKSSVILKIVLVVLILCGLGAGGWYGYSIYRKKQKEKAEQIMVRLRKEKLSKEVQDLLDEAKKLYDENKRAEALAAVSAAMKKDPASEMAKKWYEDMSQAIELEKVLPVKKLAEVKWAQAATLATGQGFTEALKAVGDTYADAEKLFAAKEYQKALPKYEEVVAESDKLQAADLRRQASRKFRDDSDAARDAAEKAQAGDAARELWEVAQGKARDALAAFEKASFEEAGELWQSAVVKYGEAVVFANGTRAVSVAEEAFSKGLAAVKPGLLDAFGGELWGSTKAAVENARELSRARKWEASVAKWGEATAMLRKAAKSAEYEETKDRMLKQYQAAMMQAARQLQVAAEAVKNDNRNAVFRKMLDEESANLDNCRKAEAYGMLDAEAHGKLDRLIEDLRIEKFHFRFPDLVWCRELKSVDPASLGAGGADAISSQDKTAGRLDTAVQVESRKAGIVFRLVPDGTFAMGRNAKEIGQSDELPKHSVVIGRPFYMSAFEVTQGQWKKVGMGNRSHFRDAGDSLPVENVTYSEAVEFCRKLCEMEETPPGTYRLPTEAEWEYACRAGTSGRFGSGENPGDLERTGWFNRNSDRTTHAAGLKQPNAFGICDMHGNVWEWCMDGIRDYDAGEVKDPVGPSGTWTAMTRGGSWNDNLEECRSANRGWARRRTEKSYDLGLRVMRVLPAANE